MYALLIERKGRSLSMAVRVARRQFLAADHTDGSEPGEVHLNPADMPEVLTIEGLKVVSDPAVRPHYVQVKCAVQIPEEGECIDSGD